MTRYYTDGTNAWKFEPGKPPMHRFTTDSKWDESAFASLEDFEEAPDHGIWEIDAEGGEA